MAYFTVEKPTAHRLPVTDIAISLNTAIKWVFSRTEINLQQTLDTQSRREAARGATDNLWR